MRTASKAKGEPACRPARLRAAFGGAGSEDPRTGHGTLP